MNIFRSHGVCATLWQNIMIYLLQRETPPWTECMCLVWSKHQLMYVLWTNLTGFTGESAAKMKKINGLWPTFNQFERWPGHLSMSNVTSFLPCILLERHGNPKFDPFYEVICSVRPCNFTSDLATAKNNDYRKLSLNKNTVWDLHWRKTTLSLEKSYWKRTLIKIIHGNRQAL